MTLSKKLRMRGDRIRDNMPTKQSKVLDAFITYLGIVCEKRPTKRAIYTALKRAEIWAAYSR